MTYFYDALKQGKSSGALDVSLDPSKLEDVIGTKAYAQHEYYMARYLREKPLKPAPTTRSEKPPDASGNDAGAHCEDDHASGPAVGLSTPS